MAVEVTSSSLKYLHITCSLFACISLPSTTMSFSSCNKFASKRQLANLLDNQLDSSSVPCRQDLFTISVRQSKHYFYVSEYVCALPTSDTTKGLIFIRQEENPTFSQAKRLCITSQRLGLRSTGKGAEKTKVGKAIFHTNVAGKLCIRGFVPEFLQ